MAAADIKAVWDRAPEHERTEAINRIGPEALRAALPSGWILTIERPLADRRQDCALTATTPASVIPDDLSIPECLRRPSLDAADITPRPTPMQRLRAIPTSEQPSGLIPLIEDWRADRQQPVPTEMVPVSLVLDDLSTPPCLQLVVPVKTEEVIDSQPEVLPEPSPTPLAWTGWKAKVERRLHRCHRQAQAAR
jgi:hypothetical protein